MLLGEHEGALGALVAFGNAAVVAPHVVAQVRRRLQSEQKMQDKKSSVGFSDAWLRFSVRLNSRDVTFHTNHESLIAARAREHPLPILLVQPFVVTPETPEIAECPAALWVGALDSTAPPPPLLLQWSIGGSFTRHLSDAYS